MAPRQCIAALVALAGGAALVAGAPPKIEVKADGGWHGLFTLPAAPDYYFIHLNSQLFWRSLEGDATALRKRADAQKGFVEEKAKEQIAKLEEYVATVSEQLSAAKTTNGTLFVITHIPPFMDNITEPAGCSNWALDFRKSVLEILAKPGLPIVFLTGHFHANVVRSTEFEASGGKHVPVQVIVSSSAGTTMDWSPLDGHHEGVCRADLAAQVACIPIGQAFVKFILESHEDPAEVEHAKQERLRVGYETSGMRVIQLRNDGQIKYRWLTIKDIFTGLRAKGFAEGSHEDFAKGDPPWMAAEALRRRMVDLLDHTDTLSPKDQWGKVSAVESRRYSTEAVRLRRRLASGSEGRAPESIFIVHIADPQLGMKHQDAKDDRSRRNIEDERKALILLATAAKSLDPAAVVVGGDIQNAWPHTEAGEDEKAAQAAFERVAAVRALSPLTEAKIPIVMTPGNHDVDDAPFLGSLEAYRRSLPPKDFEKPWEPLEADLKLLERLKISPDERPLPPEASPAPAAAAAPAAVPAQSKAPDAPPQAALQAAPEEAPRTKGGKMNMVFLWLLWVSMVSSLAGAVWVCRLLHKRRMVLKKRGHCEGMTIELRSDPRS